MTPFKPVSKTRPAPKNSAPSGRFLKRALILLCHVIPILAASGCASVGQNYVRPQTKLPAAWTTKLSGELSDQHPGEKALARWWETLHDPTLSDIIRRAVSANLDVKTALARLREARARRDMAAASWFPTIDASAAYTRNSMSSGGNALVAGQRNQYSTQFDASWEIDLFGGTRRAVEAANADLAGAGEGLHDALVTLAAETALNYVDARTFQTRLTSAENNLALQKETCGLTENRYQAGLIDALAVSQARYNLETTRAQIPALRSGLSQAINRLSTLTGKAPGALNSLMAERRPIPVAPVSVAVGIPADVLRQRPDVRKSERALAAQTARTGVAKADLYPKLTLTGVIGLESLSSGDLLTAGSRIWQYGPGLSWRVFDAGAIRQNIKVQSALQEQALIQYEATVLSALEETENALNAFIEEQNRREALNQAVSAAIQAESIARDKFEAGLADFSTVLDAQRSLVSLQDQLAQSNGAVASDLIRIYKALGGGWTQLKAGNSHKRRIAK